MLKASVDIATVEEALKGLTPDTLMATCIGAQALRRCGIRMAHLLSVMSLDSNRLLLMGYDLHL